MLKAPGILRNVEWPNRRNIRAMPVRLVIAPMNTVQFPKSRSVIPSEVEGPHMRRKRHTSRRDAPASLREALRARSFDYAQDDNVGRVVNNPEQTPR